MLETLHAIKETMEKKRAALSEHSSLGDVLTTTHLRVEREPFPHVVADNFFTPVYYARLEKYLKERLARGLSEAAEPDRFHPFLELKSMGSEWEYDGYLYIPPSDDDQVLAPFFSLSWNLFFSQLFNQPTGWATSLALHHHPPGNRTGFVHNDYVSKYFSSADRLDNGVICREVPYQRADQTLTAAMRTIALILYVGGDDARAEGGGTGLYGSKDASPASVVAPRANRLLAFQISPHSLHAFQENKGERNSITQWFHTAPAWCQKRYGHI